MFKSYINLRNIGIKSDYPKAVSFEKKDWHDYAFMNYEMKRIGVGEQGKGHELTEQNDFDLNRQLEATEGLDVIVSDKISVNRSVRDTRPKVCLSLKYLKNFPSTSIIIIFYNEWPSILFRTIHSVYNRTPLELLKEIILVNDCSTKHDEFHEYVKENFDNRVKILNLPSRKGLMKARMEGAKIATGEILIFLDSHVEVNVNWLPPLLEPIALNPTTVSTPTIDGINPNTFEIMSLAGVRGLFDDFMWYQYFPLHNHDELNFKEPHRVPIMLGCSFAIRRDLFFDIGQYDEGLEIWNGEQIEMSLKLHLCGGDLVEVPCSRVAHTYRKNQINHMGPNGTDVTAKNFKRIAEVWLDDYKQVVYQADTEKFSVDAGDLTIAKLVKEKLKCKSFQYFLENIEPEMYTRYFYQLHFPGYFAEGRIRSVAHPEHCINTMGRTRTPVELLRCTIKKPPHLKTSQFFRMTWHRKIRLWERDECLQQNLHADFCKYDENQEHQDWKYDLETKQIISFWKDKWCLAAEKNRFQLLALTLKPCDSSDTAQKWTWGIVNETALRNFDEIFWKDDRVFGLELA